MFGPPKVKPRAYPLILETREKSSNKRLLSEYTASHLITASLQETASWPNPKLIDLQPEVQWHMRPYLLDFIIEIHSAFRLKSQTLFLSMNILDRYCAKRIVYKQHYQLVGCTALWIAAKYEDKKSRVPTLHELCVMCRNVYDESMFKEMEIHLLDTLDWNVGHFTMEDCLQLCINDRINDFSLVSALLAVSRFLAEITMYKKEYLSFPASLISVTCYLVACSMLDHSDKIVSDMCIFEKRSVAVKDENDPPRVDFPPFLNGFQGEHTINQMKCIAWLLLRDLASPSEILSRKYRPLGVITVVQQFLQKNPALEPISKNIASLDIESLLPDLSSFNFKNPLLSQSADFLLSLTTKAVPTSPIAQTVGYFSSSPPPLTPSSATSTMGVKTPTAFRSPCADRISQKGTPIDLRRYELH